jgi:hypothetical protein
MRRSTINSLNTARYADPGDDEGLDPSTTAGSNKSPLAYTSGDVIGNAIVENNSSPAPEVRNVDPEAKSMDPESEGKPKGDT